jgi:GH25 family lysozyme M1 (1,4-beta-N-acetylmuramidase)
MRVALRPRAIVIAAAALVVVVIVVVVVVGHALAPHRAAAVATPGGGALGVDASGAVTWATVPSNAAFAYIEASDRASANTHFAASWKGAGGVGLLRGAYHFGVPNKSAANGATQARFFWSHGGDETKAAGALPPVLDVEFDPNGGAGTSDPTQCWKLSPAQSDAWISSFLTTLKQLSGRTPVIYTSKSYWQDCLGADSDFSGNALWVVDTSSAKAPALGFGGWSNWTFRQFAIGKQHGAFDYSEFHGTAAALRTFAAH